MCDFWDSVDVHAKKAQFLHNPARPLQSKILAFHLHCTTIMIIMVSSDIDKIKGSR